MHATTTTFGMLDPNGAGGGFSGDCPTKEDADTDANADAGWGREDEDVLLAHTSFKQLVQHQHQQQQQRQQHLMMINVSFALWQFT
ncbi:GH20833 [Drosophila grimshawi]|uniref:GH20833 n=1 Tax=Drosophila grimshawi TaxID=7222 RepID=B4JRI8_DROGR|nr:GH20833 [Drosophila grimshawi]